MRRERVERESHIVRDCYVKRWMAFVCLNSTLSGICIWYVLWRWRRVEKRVHSIGKGTHNSKLYPDRRRLRGFSWNLPFNFPPYNRMSDKIKFQVSSLFGGFKRGANFLNYNKVDAKTKKKNARHSHSFWYFFIAFNKKILT